MNSQTTISDAIQSTFSIQPQTPPIPQNEDQPQDQSRTGAQSSEDPVGAANLGNSGDEISASATAGSNPNPQRADDSDGVEGYPQFHGAEDILAPLDPIEFEHGPLLLVEGKSTKLNLPAAAAMLARDNRWGYSKDLAGLHQFHEAEGIWTKIDDRAAVGQVNAFVKRIADHRNAPSLLFKRTPSQANSIISLVKTTSLMGERPGPERHLVPVANGVLDLSGTEPRLLPHSAEYFFSCKASKPFIPGARCPRFLGELLAPALAEEDIELLQRDFGRLLVPGNPTHTISILQGVGGSGKSKLISIIEAILARQRVAHLRTSHLASRFETHAFQGKDLLVGKDVLPNFLMGPGAAMIKSLSGGDWFETEQKFGGKLPMVGNFHIIVTTNHRPLISIADDDEAWRRRLILYNFSRVRPDRIIPDFD